ncbi:5'-nucleotidase C-terminal domain-containing protein [Methanosphaerula palustris]|uniref:5'-Nucleotidase domain protein n=1 Tax=Methanosphaerula palustris (strain ATCC BAA-1556 / DSM 19958 / E1-9c) TaxID=521011 RepID=B8GGR9_METPE|nr:5'-nucleotidase C-terminal domain-containing protein [Methanosphaerula palustris]ACL16324.1 5'-Nucleotidase domain protein [Methanosphaerula palustris E1-9c]
MDNHSGDLTVLQINDTHAYLEPHVEVFAAGGRMEYRVAGGYAAIATQVQQTRDEKKGRILLLDSGDTFHGTYPAVQTKGQALVPVMNALGVDAMTAHWEFAYGPERFRDLSFDLNYPVLAINCYQRSSGRLIFPPYLVQEVGNLKIGVIGIASAIVDKGMPPSFSAGLFFTDGRKELPQYISDLRSEERVDLIVLLSHLGLPQDIRLAETIVGIDLILSGHTHNRLDEPIRINNTLICQSGCHGSFVGQVDLTVQNKQIRSARHELIPIIGIEEDSLVRELVERAVEPYREYLGTVVGTTRIPLNRATILESTMDNLLLAAVQKAAGATIALSHGWRYGAPVPAGPVTRNDLWNMIPTNPEVRTVSLTGSEIAFLFEENLEKTFSSDPFSQMGGYMKRCSGLTVYCKLENPPGYRVQGIFTATGRLDPLQEYTVAYVSSQTIGDTYGLDRAGTGTTAITALEDLLDRGPVETPLVGSVVAI